MTKIILASHGPFAESIKETVSLICGIDEEIPSFCLYANDDSEEFYENIKSSIDKKEPTLLLVDLQGGTPSNKGILLKQEFPLLRVIAGINVMMLVECMIQKDHKSIDKLVDGMLSSGKESIKEMKLEIQDIDDIDDL